MKILKTLSKYVFAAVVAIAFVACGQSQTSATSSSAKQGETTEPQSDPAKVVRCYDDSGKALPEASALIVDSIKIVYEHRPSEIVLTIRNASANSLGNITGIISLYGEDGQKYDTVDFSKSCQLAAGETSSISIYLGDKRVHPNQEWNRDVQLHFAKTNPGRFSFIGCDNNWCECIAKVVEVRIDSFEVFE